MQLFEINFRVAVEHAQMLADIASVVADGGLYIEDYSDLEGLVEEIAHIDLIDEELRAKERDTAIVHLYFEEGVPVAEKRAFIEERLGALGIPFETGTGSVDDASYMEAYKKYYKPMRIGDSRLVIVPCWEEYEEKPGDVVVRLDPGIAFGTGGHETTRLCLAMLDGLVSGASSLLDIGTGSGILAIAALLLGAQAVTAVDIDPLSVKVAKENAALNGVDKRLDVLCTDLTDGVGGVYDIVCSNIVADVILSLIPVVGRFLKPGGVWLASGIIAERTQEVRAAMEAGGWQIIDCKEDNGWSAIRCVLK